MEGNYKKMVEKASDLIRFNTKHDKAFELIIRLTESVKIINPDLTDKINDLPYIIGR